MIHYKTHLIRRNTRGRYVAYRHSAWRIGSYQTCAAAIAALDQERPQRGYYAPVRG